MNNLYYLLAMGGFAIFLFIAIFIVLYIIFVLGLYGLAKKENTGNEYFSFIPILQFYVIGKILKAIKISNYTIPKLELVLPILPIVVIIVGNILGTLPLVGDLLVYILNIAYLIFSIIVTYNFYKKYKGSNAVLMTVLTYVLFFMGPIYIFNMRNAIPIESETIK